MSWFFKARVVVEQGRAVHFMSRDEEASASPAKKMFDAIADPKGTLDISNSLLE